MHAILIVLSGLLELVRSFGLRVAATCSFLHLGLKSMIILGRAKTGLQTSFKFTSVSQSVGQFAVYIPLRPDIAIRNLTLKSARPAVVAELTDEALPR